MDSFAIILLPLLFWIALWPVTLIIILVLWLAYRKKSIRMVIYTCIIMFILPILNLLGFSFYTQDNVPNTFQIILNIIFMLVGSSVVPVTVYYLMKSLIDKNKNVEITNIIDL